MALFHSGDDKNARKLQDRFLAEVLGAGEDHCSCPAACKHHGNCLECVVIHRGHGDHLPYCLQAMLNSRIDALSALTEHSSRAGSGQE